MRCLLEKQRIVTTIKVDQIGEIDNDGDSTGDTKTPTKTPTKTKAAITPKESIDAGSARKKRKATEMKRDKDDLVDVKEE